jgi:hypothetical protein
MDSIEQHRIFSTPPHQKRFQSENHGARILATRRILPAGNGSEDASRDINTILVIGDNHLQRRSAVEHTITIILGRHDRTTIAEFFTGSVSGNHVLHHAGVLS